MQLYQKNALKFPLIQIIVFQIITDNFYGLQ